MVESEFASWVKDLPTGWIDAYVCARRLFAALKDECANADPAPWKIVQSPEYWGPQLGKTSDEHVFDEKLSERVVAAFQSAIVSSQLVPSWFDGSAFRCIPSCAFDNRGQLYAALLQGQFEIDPLWPDEWQKWSGCAWAFPSDQFEHWITNHALSIAGLPIPSDEVPKCEIDVVGSRLPSESTRVPLSEAVSWIAFGLALNAGRLERAIRWQRLSEGDLQAAQRRLEGAVTTLLTAASDGLVPMYGRHVAGHGEKGARTEKIDPLMLEDYANAFIVNEDSLYYGTGLFIWYQAPNQTLVRGSDRNDHFTHVSVERQALISHCGDQTRSSAPLLVPIPAALPDLGSVMGLEEAISLLAHNHPSYDVELWMDREGNIDLRDPWGKALPDVAEGERPPFLVAFVEANRKLREALRKGILRGFVAPPGSPVLSIPRLYWNSVNPECVEYIYRGTSGSDSGRGCPILLSHQSFDGWRTETTPPPTAEARSTANGERECREWLLAAFATDPKRRRSKKSFQDEALKRFAGRLSGRGFVRVWDGIASQSGRSKPGRKS